MYKTYKVVWSMEASGEYEISAESADEALAKVEDMPVHRLVATAEWYDIETSLDDDVPFDGEYEHPYDEELEELEA